MIHVFKLMGKFGSWRKFYTNSSSLSYVSPTPTTIQGMIASVLEMERDSYYELFNSENLKIGIILEFFPQKQVHSVNYLNTQNNKGRTQIKLELITNINFNNEISYLLFLKPSEKIIDVFNRFADRVKSNDFGFGIYLGQRQFCGYIEYIDFLDEEKKVKTRKIHSVIPGSYNLDVNETFKDDRIFLEKDLFPREFKFENKRRILTKNTELIIPYPRIILKKEIEAYNFKDKNFILF